MSCEHCPAEVREGCRRARQALRVCELIERSPAGGSIELEEVLGAYSVGMSYEELQQFDVDSSYYDPDVGPYYWEG